MRQLTLQDYSGNADLIASVLAPPLQRSRMGRGDTGLKDKQACSEKVNRTEKL